MPYCCQCGKVVSNNDVYCAVCGARQPAPTPVTDYLHGISSRTASLLCYIPIIGWIVAIVVLASARFRDDTRAVQRLSRALPVCCVVDCGLGTQSDFSLLVVWRSAVPQDFSGPDAGSDLVYVDFHDHKNRTWRSVQAANFRRAGGKIRFRATVARTPSVCRLETRLEACHRVAAGAACNVSGISASTKAITAIAAIFARKSSGLTLSTVSARE